MLVDIHLGNPASLMEDLIASFTAKKMAPAGMLERSGPEIPSKLPSNNCGKFWSVYFVFGICNRTVAVSRGYLTTVLTAETAVPETKPEILS